MTVRVIHGDMREQLQVLRHDGVRVHSIVTDPPYGLAFMGKHWDAADNVAFQYETWRLCFDLLPPGGHLLAFGSTRNGHRLATAIEDAGFEIRDCLAWIFGSGFPKSLNVSRKLKSSLPADAQCACDPNCSQTVQGSSGDYPASCGSDDEPPPTLEGDGQASRTSQSDARQHSLLHLHSDDQVAGQERIRSASAARPSSADCLPQVSRLSANSQAGDSAQSDISLSTLNAGLMAEHRTANDRYSTQHSGDGSVSSSLETPINGLSDANLPRCDKCGKIKVPDGLGSALKPAFELIYLCRRPLIGTVAANVLAHGAGALNIDGCRVGTADGDYDHPGNNGIEDKRNVYGAFANGNQSKPHTAGRWPANVAHDGSAEVVKAFPESASTPRTPSENHHTGRVTTFQRGSETSPYFDEGSAARFFYSAKADERGTRPGGFGNVGADKGSPVPNGPTYLDTGNASRFFYSSKADADDRLGSKHPTVKPVDLMRWLVRLVTPPGGTVLDPFAGSGTTGMACMAEGFDCILVEREAEYVADINARIAHVHGEDTPLFGGAMQIAAD
jgi:DNA modification methylase